MVHTTMATVTKLKSGSWRVQVRRKGQYVASTFRLQADARNWARDIERRIDLGHNLGSPPTAEVDTIGKLIALHVRDMCDVGRAPLRSKSYCLEKLDRTLGSTKVQHLHREQLVAFGKHRAKEGAGPVTLAMELGYLRTVLLHAAAVHGIPTSVEPVDQARIALKRLALIGKGKERDRRPTPDELIRILAYFDANPRQIIPFGRMVRFAIATGMRQNEICQLHWTDVDAVQRVVVIRNRKHPRDKLGNNQTIALVSDAGWDPLVLMDEQAKVTDREGRVFPYSGRSVGTAFRRACRRMGINDLRFHDLRHETASRLFEAGYQIPEVALVTGHKDWKMLRRYTNHKAQDLAKRATTGVPRQKSLLRPFASLAETPPAIDTCPPSGR